MHRHRHPSGGVAAEERAGEAVRHDANHGERRPVDRERPADDGRIAAEAAFPEPVGQHDHRSRLDVLFSREAAADRRLRAQHGEVAAGGDLQQDLFGGVAVAPVHLREGERRHLGEHLVLRAQILVVQVRQREVARIARVGHEHGRETAGLLDGNRPEQDRVDQAEDSGVGADAKRKRQHGDRREPRTLDEQTGGVLDVVKHGSTVKSKK